MALADISSVVKIPEEAIDGLAVSGSAEQLARTVLPDEHTLPPPHPPRGQQGSARYRDRFRAAPAPADAKLEVAYIAPAG